MTTETIWNEFSAKLLGFIKSRVSDEENAKDILQEVFIKIHINAGKLEDEHKLTSWIYQITRNTIIDFYRKRKIVTVDLDLPETIEEQEEALNPQFIKCLSPFIKQLSGDFQDALNRTHFGKLSQKEYAQELNISYTAVKSRVQRARKKLNELFTQCCAIKTDAYGNIISSSIDNCSC